ncbi:MAG: exosortase U, partial [Pirellulaceae bacterium]
MSPATQTSGSTDFQTADRWKLLGPPVVFLAVLASVPYVLIYLKNLWEQPHYQFFPLVLAAVTYLAYQRWSSSVYQPSRSLAGRFFRFVRFILLASGILGTLCATIFASPWMGYFGFVCSLAAWFAHRQDAETGRSLLHLSLPMALIWQPPYDTIRTGDTILIQQLQIISARLSSKILDVLGYIHFQPGTVLQVPGTSFGVAEACSGIQSFFAVLCVGALLVAYFRRGPLRAILLLATSPFWAALMNTVRITLIPIAYSSFGIDLSHGFLHDLLGYTTMGLAIALMLSTDELLAAASHLVSGKFTAFSTREGGPPTAAETKGATSISLARFTLWPAALLFAACCSIQSYDAYQSWSIQRDTIDFFRDSDLLEMSKSVMPGELAGWSFALYDRQERGRNNDDLGERSDMWYFEAPFGRVSVSFDQRFPGWHELTRCYRNAGWSPEKR